MLCILATENYFADVANRKGESIGFVNSIITQFDFAQGDSEMLKKMKGNVMFVIMRT